MLKYFELFHLEKTRLADYLEVVCKHLNISYTENVDWLQILAIAITEIIKNRN